MTPCPCPYCGSSDIPHVCSAAPAPAPVSVQAPAWSVPPDPGPADAAVCPQCEGPIIWGWLFDYCVRCGGGVVR